MMDINLYLFQKINGLSGKNKWLDAFARAGGEFAIFGMLGWFVITLWLSPNFSVYFFWQAFFVFMATGCGGWMLSWVIALIVREPRPFLIVPHDHEMFRPLFPSLFKWKSFPSDHTMFAFTIFFTALILHLPLSWPLLILALWVAGGRVYAGVHYPGDILAGAAVAMFVGAVVNYIITV